MQFDYDPAKSVANAEKHGLSLGEAKAVFSDVNMLVLPARKRGEKRRMAIGRIGWRIASVIYTEQGGSTRLISARWANDRERRAYYGK